MAISSARHWKHFCTLAYALVTGLLVALYAGLVLLSTDVLTLSSPVAVAASTLIALKPAHVSVWLSQGG